MGFLSNIWKLGNHGKGKNPKANGQLLTDDFPSRHSVPQTSFRDAPTTGEVLSGDASDRAQRSQSSTRRRPRRPQSRVDTTHGNVPQQRQTTAFSNDESPYIITYRGTAESSTQYATQSQVMSDGTLTSPAAINAPPLGAGVVHKHITDSQPAIQAYELPAIPLSSPSHSGHQPYRSLGRGACIKQAAVPAESNSVELPIQGGYPVHSETGWNGSSRRHENGEQQVETSTTERSRLLMEGTAESDTHMGDLTTISDADQNIPSNPQRGHVAEQSDQSVQREVRAQEDSGRNRYCDLNTTDSLDTANNTRQQIEAQERTSRHEVRGATPAGPQGRRREEFEKYKNELSSSRAEISGNKLAAEHMEEQLKNLENHQRSQESLIQHLQQENTAFKKKNGELNQIMNSEQRKLHKHSRYIQQIESEKNDLQVSIRGWERDYLSLKRQRDDLDAEASDLHQKISSMEAAMQRSELQWQLTLDNEVAQLKGAHQSEQERWLAERAILLSQHEKEKQDLLDRHQAKEKAWFIAKETMRSQHEIEKQDMSARHQDAMDCLSIAHAHESAQHEKRHAAEAQSLRSEITAGKRQLASYNSSSSYIAIPDQQLKAYFQKLAQRVSNIATLVQRPLNNESLKDMDPDGYLARHADQPSHAWPRFVRSVCWVVMMEGFFALPLGFGALGREGEGYEKLAQLRVLFVKEVEGSGPLFPSDKHVNIWRATLFEAILGEVTDSSRASVDHGFAALFHANVSLISRNLFAVMRRLSASQLGPQVSSQIYSIAHELGVLALQMGAQRAHVFLETIGHGAWVKSDEKFVDESGGSGSRFQVDIVTLPCMCRVGDGREDGKIQSIIMKGGVVGLKG